jgi:hypothetical protein
VDKTNGELFKIANNNIARMLVEIGWTGGATAAFPFLAVQKRYERLHHGTVPRGSQV